MQVHGYEICWFGFGLSVEDFKLVYRGPYFAINDIFSC